MAVPMQTIPTYKGNQLKFLILFYKSVSSFSSGGRISLRYTRSIKPPFHFEEERNLGLCSLSSSGYFPCGASSDINCSNTYYDPPYVPINYQPQGIISVRVNFTNSNWAADIQDLKLSKIAVDKIRLYWSQSSSQHCNSYRIGQGKFTYGIYCSTYENVTYDHCRKYKLIQDFYYDIPISGGNSYFLVQPICNEVTMPDKNGNPFNCYYVDKTDIVPPITVIPFTLNYISEGSTGFNSYNNERLVFICEFTLSNVSSYIEEYSKDGDYIRKIELGAYFNYIVDIDVDNQGRIFAIGTKYENYLAIRGCIFTNNGEIISKFGDGVDLIKDLNGITGISASPDGKAYILEGHRVSIFRPKPGLSQTISSSAYAIGANNTYWKTEVYLANLGAEAQDLELIYHPSLGAENLDVATSLNLREERLNLILDAGEVKHFKDILTEFFSSPETFGWLEISHSSSGLKVRARIYTEQEFVGAGFVSAHNVGAKFHSARNDIKKGTYGQGIKVLSIEHLASAEGFLLNLEENENFRTNTGIMPLSVSDIRSPNLIKFNLILIKDSQIIDEREIELKEGNLVQINNILSTLFKKTGDGFTLKIKPSIEEQNLIKYTAYISKVDNSTGDAFFQLISF